MMKNLVFFIVFGILLTVQVVYGVTIDLSLLPKTATVQPYVSENVTIRCTLTPDRYMRNRYGYNSASTENVVKVRILRKPYDPKMNTASWQVMAQLSDTDTDVHVEVDGIQAEGVIYERTDSRTTYLSVTWSKAVAETLGTFMCDCLTIANEQTATLKRSSNLEIGTNLKAEDFARIIYVQREMAVEEMKEYKKRVDGNLKELEKNISEIMIRQSKLLVDMEVKLKGIVDSGFLLFWPAGSYGLLAPQTGCPTDGANTWTEGYVRHHTESTQRNTDEVSTSNHLMTPVLSRENAENFVTQHFCLKTSATVVGPKWPAGSYCINKKGMCPVGFQAGSVFFDEENTSPLTNISGDLPDGVYNNDTLMFFCCRGDESADHEIHLPTSVPFYLYRRGGKCQKVFGMNVTSEFMVLDTENDNNQDEMKGQALPDVHINNIRLELCYYESH